MLPILNKSLTIQSKEAELIPFVPNIIQLKLLRRIAELWQDRKPVRMIIPKARQHGISTVLTCIAYCQTAFRKDRFALTVADKADKSTGLFDKFKLIHEYINPIIKTETKRSNARELIFSETRSTLRIQTAGTEEIARSATYHFFHGSEVAYYPNAEAVMTGVLQTVPEYWDTMVFLESTGNGMSGYFYELCDKARKGENDWEVFFIPWQDNPEYSRPIPPDYVLVPQKEGRWGDEVRLHKDFRITLEQLYWRRNKIDNYCKGDLFKFMQEYPATLEEAFLASGFPVFDQIKLIHINEHHTSYPIHEAIIDNKEIKWTQGGWLKFWSMCEHGWRNRYVAFADTGGKWQGADYYSVHVIDRVNREVAAVMHGHFDAYQFAWYLFILCTYYDKCLCAVEINKWSSETERNGISVLDNIMNKYKYGNMYVRNVYDQTNKVIDTHIGFHTNPETKQLLVDRGKRYVNEESEQFKINDKNTVNEMMTYIISIKNGNSVYEAAQGAKDDRVISFLGALLIADEMQPPSRIPPKTKKKPLPDDVILKVGA